MSVNIYANDPRLVTEPDGSYSILDPTGSSYWHVLGEGTNWSAVDSIAGGAPIHGTSADDVIGQIIGPPQGS
jgi:hypothetical protein